MSTQQINAMTVDVEDYFHVSAFADVIDRQQWSNRQSRVVANTTKLLDLFAKKNLQATFFVLGWVAEREPQLIRDIAARGHEIACHGYSHQLVYRQTPAEFRQETAKAKAILEDIVQVPVTGYRAASYSITGESWWALDILCELGFLYDSSVFPIRHDRYGVPDAQETPHLLTTANGNSLVEFPLTVARFFKLRLPVAGGGYFRIFPYALSRAGLKQANDRGQPFVFYLHPWEVDPEQPRIEASLLSRFRHYCNLDKTEPRLQRLTESFRFDTMRNVLTDAGLLPATVSE